MDCIHCGKNIGNNIGACDECKTLLGQRQTSINTAYSTENRLSKYKQHDPLSSSTAKLVLGFLGIILLGVITFLNLYSQPLIREYTNRELRISDPDKKRTFVFKAENSVVHEGKLYQTTDSYRSLKFFGGSTTLHYLSHGDYDEYIKFITANPKTCTSNFLNKRIKRVTIFLADNESEDLLKKTWLKQGDTIRVIGNKLAFKELQDGRGKITSISGLEGIIVQKFIHNNDLVVDKYI